MCFGEFYRAPLVLIATKFPGSKYYRKATPLTRGGPLEKKKTLPPEQNKM